MELPKFSTVYSLTGLITEWSHHVPENERETVLVEKYRALGVAALDELGNHWVNDADLQETVAGRVKPEIEHEFPDSLKEPVKKARFRYGTWLLQHAHAAARMERDRRQGKARGAVGETDVMTTSPAPGPQPYGVTDRGAEHLVADWMKHLGADGAMVTQFVGDGGIDVISERFIAQVKNYAGSVGAIPMRELAGVAAVDGRQPLFFTSGTFIPSAIAFADSAGIALFRYDVLAGGLFGENALGRAFVRDGLHGGANDAPADE